VKRTPIILTSDLKPAVDEMWKLCFPEDTADERRLLLDLLFSKGRGLAYSHTDGTLQCMLFCLPVTYSDCQTTWPAAYIYAVGTHPTYRRQGLAASLLTDAHDHLRADGFCGTFLHPASTSLQAYYEKLGYVPFFEAATLSADTIFETTEPLSMACSSAVYLREREHVLNTLNIPHINWGTDITETAAALSALYGGRLLCGNNWFGMIVPQNDGPRWLEGAFLDEKAFAFTPTLRDVVFPVIKKVGIPIGWWYSLNNAGIDVYRQTRRRHPYMGMTLS